MQFDRKEDFMFLRWAAAIKKRDRYTCQICDRRGVELNSHHINGWNWCIEDRYSMDNGITLCREHHDEFHKLYGHGDNTEEQFEEYKKTCEMILRSINISFEMEESVERVIRDLDGYVKDQKYLLKS